MATSIEKVCGKCSRHQWVTYADIPFVPINANSNESGCNPLECRVCGGELQDLWEAGAQPTVPSGCDSTQIYGETNGK